MNGARKRFMRYPWPAYWAVNANSGSMQGLGRRKWTFWEKLWWRLRYGKLGD